LLSFAARAMARRWQARIAAQHPEQRGNINQTLIDQTLGVT